MKVIEFLLWEAYYICFSLSSVYRKFIFIHLMGIITFIISGIENRRKEIQKT